MSNAIYKKDLHDVALAVAQGSKNYTDKTKEEIYWHIGDYSISTQADNTTASTKTVPSGATRCKIKRIYGLTEKFNPSVAYDDASTMTKTMPNVVYDFDCSVVYGNSEVSDNLIVLNDVAETTVNGITYSVSNGVVNLKTGTSTQATYLNLGTFTLSAGTYYLKAFGNNAGAYQTYFAVLQDNQSQNIAFSYDSTSSGTFTLNATTTLNYVIVIRNAISVSNIQFKDMLVVGSTAPTEFKQGFEGIHNLELSGLKSEGVNLANTALFELGAINTTNGADSVNNERMRSNYIEVKPSTQYTLKWDNNDVNYFFYDENKTYIQKSVGGTFTTTATTKYVRFYSGLITTSTQIMLNKGSTALPYEPYISQTLPIDLTSIEDSGGNKLFADGSLKGVGNVADEITPYKAIKRIEPFTITSSSTYLWISSTWKYATLNVGGIFKQGGQILIYGNDNIVSGIYASNGNIMFEFAIAYTSNQEVKDALVGVKLLFERATPIEVSIDWSSTLRGIQGYSNGSITLQNTYNMDTANTITYNSIIKENCCAKIVQSRGGNVVKTINLPTTTSDGYSAGSASNVRDFTTNKRGTNVNKGDLGSLDYTYNASNYQIFASGTGTQAQLGFKAQSITLTKLYTYATTFSDFITTDKCVYLSTDGNLYARDSAYTDATIFKTANVGNPLYYELADDSKTESDITAIENIIEVEPSDIIAFLDENDNAVNVPSDLTYRIEVERE